MRIVVAMSGGVDSSVAAALLAQSGHEVIGLSMQLYDQREGQTSFGTCCTIDDLHDARRVAHRLNIPHYIVNFEQEFQRTVVANFVEEYAAGRTPIPCAHCNSDLKFATLLDRARGFDADVVATGHYARVETDASSGRRVLRRGVDSGKDQSYFLFSLTQEQLAAASFPVGHLAKDAVRDLARDLGLTVADKPDSQEICFVPDGDYAAFIERQTETMPRDGAIVNQAGDVLGRHGGVHKFTVGQRKGLGIALAEPMYVLELRSADQTVVVGTRPALERSSLTASQVNWISGEPPAGALPITAQIRHRHRAADATVRAVDATRAAVEFDVPQTAITPGQAVVFYDGDTVLGGGWIDG
ncbi:MAG TPA: tRNA 2-thiouridine(34) synthase MnmA [Vicinamibacterales bacterium]|nr:tRNA 2-thiouridine(34) synthase MnmA [Vicinamibacterales bacterium]